MSPEAASGVFVAAFSEFLVAFDTIALGLEAELLVFFAVVVFRLVADFFGFLALASTRVDVESVSAVEDLTSTEVAIAAVSFVEVLASLLSVSEVGAF